MGCCSLPSLPEGALSGQQIYVVWGRLSHRILIDFCQFYDPSGVTDLSVGETASDGVSPSRTSRGAGSQQPQSSSHSSHHRFHFFNEPTHTSSSSLQPALEWSFGFPTDLAFKKRRIEHSSIHPCTASGQKLCPLGTAMTRVWIKIASKTDPAICVFRMDFRSTPKRQKTASHPRPRWALASQGPNCKTVT